MGFAADELYDMGRKLAALGTAHDVAPLGGELGARHHFGDDEAGAEGLSEAAEREIGDAGHRSQHHWISERKIPDM
jgi:hypothetical protein